MTLPIAQQPAKPKSATYASLADITRSLVGLLRPPERLTVAEAATRYRYVNNPGSYVGKWDNSITPYMVEPMNELDSRELRGVIFVGPAQCGKTDTLLVNWLVHGIMCNPMDMILYAPTMSAGRDFSMRRVDRLHRHSKPVGDMLRDTRDADNKFDKHYKSGMMLAISYPSVTELAGRPVAHVALTDYDRMPEDVDGDGSPYDLASKRTTTFGSFAMALAESSPSRELTDPRWIRRTPHEAPPTTGILSLYNRGDRRRYVWPCPYCHKYFEGEWSMLEWDTLTSDMESAATVRMVCPHCQAKIAPDDRKMMYMGGAWIKEGEYVDDDWQIKGDGRRNNIASFWLKGVAAAFAPWRILVETYIVADREYQTTGSEEALRKFYNNDLAEIYIPKGQDTERVPEQLKSRTEWLGEKVVPEGTRFLVANVDVQKNMFVVQVHGICPGEPFDIVLVDRFSITKSDRLDDDGEHAWVKPATYLEDWNKITELVIEKTYPLGDGSGRRMMIKMTTCDSGGREGVTTNAYNYYRNLRSQNLHGRFHLVKGDSNPGQARSRISYPDAIKKDKNSAARGDIPVLMLNSNMLKDSLNGRLDCITPGKGLVRFPDWLPDWFFMELCSERRTTKGWENPSHSRNEAWDLMYYCIGVCVSKLLMVEHIKWDNPPRWCAEWDSNDLVSKAEEPKRFAKQAAPEYDFSKFGQRLA